MTEQDTSVVGADPAQLAEQNLPGVVSNPNEQQQQLTSTQFLGEDGKPLGVDIADPAKASDLPLPTYDEAMQRQMQEGAKRLLDQLNNPIDTDLATIQNLIDDPDITAEDKITTLKEIFTDLQNSIREELKRLKASQDRTL